MEALYRVHERGLVRHIGVSNFSLHDFDAAQACFKGHIVSDQLEYNLLDRSVEDEFLPYAAEKGVTVIAYSPLNQGRVFGSEAQRLVLESLAKKYKKTISQIVLRWLVAHEPVTAVAKMKSVERVKENIAAMEFDLLPEDIAQLGGAPRLEVASVPIAEIRLSAPSHRVLYKTLDEALENKDDLLPSPVTLAEVAKKGGSIKPIRLTPASDASGNYRYDIDQYDAMDQVKKYWAWVIARGADSAIPAFILPRAHPKPA
jgi:hypothetical protein